MKGGGKETGDDMTLLLAALAAHRTHLQFVTPSLPYVGIVRYSNSQLAFEHEITCVHTPDVAILGHCSMMKQGCDGVIKNAPGSMENGGMVRVLRFHYVGNGKSHCQRCLLLLCRVAQVH